jgi:hypothetical protein
MAVAGLIFWRRWRRWRPRLPNSASLPRSDDLPLTDSTRVITYPMPTRSTEVTKREEHELNHSADQDIAKEAIGLDGERWKQVSFLVRAPSATPGRDGQPLIHHTLAASGSAVWRSNRGLRSLPIVLIGHGGGTIKQGMSRTCAGSTPLSNVRNDGSTHDGCRMADAIGPLFNNVVFDQEFPCHYSEAVDAGFKRTAVWIHRRRK